VDRVREGHRVEDAGASEQDACRDERRREHDVNRESERGPLVQTDAVARLPRRGVGEGSARGVGEGSARRLASGVGKAWVEV
jgi:hypothetical protein